MKGSLIEGKAIKMQYIITIGRNFSFLPIFVAIRLIVSIFFYTFALANSNNII